MNSKISAQTLRFVRRGQAVALGNVAPDRTLLEVLREDLQLTATKEGCGEGDCGACTVVLAQAVNGKLQYQAINSCIRLAHSVDGMAVFTAEDLSAPTLKAGASPDLHPCQEAMVQCHGSQCGFCTPGFVMSLFGMYQNSGGGQGITREQAQVDLSGNLCRCTGYRPILDAAEKMGSLPLPAGCGVDEAATVAALKSLKPRQNGDESYLRPTTLAALLQARSAHPKAQVVAGCTDVGLWVTKLHKRFERVLDVTAARELQRVETYPHHIAIGAAVNLTDAFAALVKERPQLKTFSQRFAGLPVRNSGTLGGNVANGSPIGDAMPLLIALGASVVLMRWKKTAAGGEIAHRELRLEDLYTGYRTNVMRADELLCWIKVPRPTGHASSAAPGRPKQASAPSGGSEPNAVGGVGAEELMRVYKISKRFDDDISAVCLAIQMTLKDGTVQQVSIGAGGVAATPARAHQTEAALLGQPWNADTVMAATAALRAEFQPISDMRASAAYRQTVLGNLLRRFWLESQGMTTINLESLTASSLEATA
ncbi:MAG: FAD binding domain-containing protein [Gammaproteobacteria bacterium]|uniref:xanthine dehydrogenase small subunit n=1 Tax=Hydrogenophaga sp. TaxID=1904254 RepID=UPI0025C5FA00|nr:FAD binding domain-containing protein [Hydrogenophaga sp.]MBU4184340.1 FAD binding domain-containing protein [Gammaproteobacteria bacterium]MBU4279280.1 FAD binding domain-containing protein [Gammaproteobacteria bacterium]MBU4322110.1 FAD binding domain-containing protein [Gammaproteobacteria bacterium]MBU4507302.1 FAD binding domain-containing protein [Gammaproteobacteria bacterium]MCG2655998.1 FAD binding domain-containing protein [Hydrogenophaga sp.]